MARDKVILKNPLIYFSMLLIAFLLLSTRSCTISIKKYETCENMVGKTISPDPTLVDVCAEVLRDPVSIQNVLL